MPCAKNQVLGPVHPFVALPYHPTCAEEAIRFAPWICKVLVVGHHSLFQVALCSSPVACPLVQRPQSSTGRWKEVRTFAGLSQILFVRDMRFLLWPSVNFPDEPALFVFLLTNTLLYFANIGVVPRSPSPEIPNTSVPLDTPELGHIIIKPDRSVP